MNKICLIALLACASVASAQIPMADAQRKLNEKLAMKAAASTQPATPEQQINDLQKQVDQLKADLASSRAENEKLKSTLAELKQTPSDEVVKVSVFQLKKDMSPDDAKSFFKRYGKNVIWLRSYDDAPVHCDVFRYIADAKWTTITLRFRNIALESGSSVEIPE